MLQQATHSLLQMPRMLRPAHRSECRWCFSRCWECQQLALTTAAVTSALLLLHYCLRHLPPVLQLLLLQLVSAAAAAAAAAHMTHS
jgi:hypothetical protein